MPHVLHPGFDTGASRIGTGRHGTATFLQAYLTPRNDVTLDTWNNSSLLSHSGDWFAAHGTRRDGWDAREGFDR
jgi:hypothetical protein